MADGDDDRKRVRLSAAKRREQLAQLVLCRTKLSESEVALLREVFPEILAMYQGDVRRYLQRRGLDEEEAKDAAQDVFVSLHRKIVEEGFPDKIRAKLYSLARGAFANRLRGHERDPASVGLPSSGSEPPKTPPDLDRAMDLGWVAPQVLALLTDDQREVVELVLIDRLSHSEAADVLGIALGTVKSRVMAGKQRMLELLEQLLPPEPEESHLMDEGERWIYLDGPEPDHVRPVLDALRRVPPEAAEESARFEREFFEKLDAQRADAPPTPEPVAEAPARAGVPRPPERLAGTAAIPLEARGQKATLPFMAPEQVPAAKKAARTMQVPVMKRRGVAETTPVEDDAITRAVAALPFRRSAVAAAVFPTLSLHEYASLHAELSVWPERAGEILVRYQVGSKAAQGALDAHWATRFGEEVGLRAAFERKLGEFVGWLRAHRR